MQETWTQSVGWEDPLEEEMATQSSYSFLENPMNRGAWQAVQSMGSRRVEHNLTNRRQQTE